MRSLFAVLVLITTCLSPAAVSAQDESGWKISNNDVLIEILPDADLEITETITVRFDVEKHGIYRTIPIHTTVGNESSTLRFKLLGVTDAANRAHKQQTTVDKNTVKIHAGDPDRKVIGTQVYKFVYRISRAILDEDEQQVLRWNAIGHEWGVPMDAATVTVKLPKQVALGDVKCLVYSGYQGSKTTRVMAPNLSRNDMAVTIENLRPRQGLTVEAKMPRDSVRARDEGK